MQIKNELPENPQVGDLCVWHIAQVGRVGAFHVPVKSVEEAKLVIAVLADYDLFQYENRIKGDYANVTGLLHFEGKHPEVEGNGWFEWNDEFGYDINEVIRNEDAGDDDAEV